MIVTCVRSSIELARALRLGSTSWLEDRRIPRGDGPPNGFPVGDISTPFSSSRYLSHPHSPSTAAQEQIGIGNYAVWDSDIGYLNNLKLGHWTF